MCADAQTANPLGRKLSRSRSLNESLDTRNQSTTLLTCAPRKVARRFKFGQPDRDALSNVVRGVVEKLEARNEHVNIRPRGYPVSDFEQRAADISVDHPLVNGNRG